MESIQFDPRAEEEFLLGAKYYERQESGLGYRFVLAVQATGKNDFNHCYRFQRYAQ